MESEEAIMENENNSNLESESNKDNDQLQPAEESLDALPADVTSGGGCISAATDGDASNMMAYQNPVDKETLGATDVGDLPNAEQDDHLDLEEPEETNKSDAVPISGISGTEKEESLQDYEDFIGADENSQSERPELNKPASNDFMERTVNTDGSNAQAPDEISNHALQGEPMEDDSLSLDQAVNPNKDNESKTHPDEISASEAQNSQPGDDGDEDMNEDVGTFNSENNHQNSNEPQNSGDDKGQEGTYWDDDIDLLGEDSQDGTKTYKDSREHDSVALQGNTESSSIVGMQEEPRAADDNEELMVVDNTEEQQVVGDEEQTAVDDRAELTVADNKVELTAADDTEELATIHDKEELTAEDGKEEETSENAADPGSTEETAGELHSTSLVVSPMPEVASPEALASDTLQEASVHEGNISEFVSDLGELETPEPSLSAVYDEDESKAEEVTEGVNESTKKEINNQAGEAETAAADKIDETSEKERAAERGEEFAEMSEIETPEEEEDRVEEPAGIEVSEIETPEEEEDRVEEPAGIENPDGEKDDSICAPEERAISETDDCIQDDKADKASADNSVSVERTHFGEESQISDTTRESEGLEDSQAKGYDEDALDGSVGVMEDEQELIEKKIDSNTSTFDSSDATVVPQASETGVVESDDVRSDRVQDGESESPKVVKDSDSSGDAVVVDSVHASAAEDMEVLPSATAAEPSEISTEDSDRPAEAASKDDEISSVEAEKSLVSDNAETESDKAPSVELTKAANERDAGENTEEATEVTRSLPQVSEEAMEVDKNDMGDNIGDAESSSNTTEKTGSGVTDLQLQNGNEGENSLDKDKSISESKGHESDEDIVEIPQIKKETGTSDEAEPASGEAGDSSKAEPVAAQNIKLEPGTDKVGDGGEDVVVLDDEGEVLPIKKETGESKATENGLGIQISAVSGQQHQLHANAEQNLGTPDPTATGKPDVAKSSKSGKSKMQTCIVCQKTCKCKYNIVRNGDIKHLCDDACFKQFRKSPSMFLKGKEDSKLLKKPAADILSDLASKVDPVAAKSIRPSPQGDMTVKQSAYKTCAVCQLMDLNAQQSFCNWKGLDFCGESCLGKFQANLNTSCSFCHAYIPLDMRATFCLKIGNDMRPFCKQRCYNEFKKKLRLCAFCQRDIAAVPSAFTAMVGTDGKFREFCSQACLKKMESQVSDVEVLSVDKGNLKQETITCSVCEKKGPMKHTVRYQGKVNKLCSDLCLSAFQYTNKINMSKCDSCGTICTAEEAQAHFVQFEGQVKRFCSDQCVSLFRKANSKGVLCKWCGTKKLNFDMIERLDAENKYQMFCSLNCLSLYRVNLQAKSNQAVSCDQCRKVVPAQYHLTMSDASVRNFCSYTCVMTFQSQFVPKHTSPTLGQALSSTMPQAQIPQQLPPLIPQNQQQKTPTSKRGRMSTRQASAKQQSPSFPVISNVISLAPPGGDQQNISLGMQTSTAAPGVMNSQAATTMASNMVPSGDGKHQILIQAAPPKSGKNKSLQCRPVTQTKATSCRPHSQSKEIQTDEVPAKSVCVPIPVPIYIPMPTVMFTAPTPRLIPIPLPIPVPIFIPTTRKSANGISKTIKEIVERMPADPLEAELLMMAEAVAADKRPGDSDTDSEADAAAEDYGLPVEEEVMRPAQTPREEDSLIMRKREGQGEEDMIQMALRMAEEMSGPIEDLETSVEPVAVSNEPPSQHQHGMDAYGTHVEDEYIPSRGRGRGAKRPGRGRSPATRPKRQRTERPYNEEDSLQSEPAPPPQSLEPPPDANYRLKFTYGVNAWRHWVISKNAQIEKTKQSTGSYRMRLFPTDILKCTTDELNFTLCMFIKEVRKPNGDEYSPDSIYYLCLGIQQFLYENGRIDNIFTDMYFDKFTNTLHELLKTLQPKVNNQGQMLCRIEEEHLWESKQLGAHSPFVLLNTLIYFHTKHFILKTAQEHMSLSFAQILKHWKKGVPVKGQAASCGKNVSLRFYCLANGKKDGLAARKSKEGVPVYEVTENFDNPLRCPVKLYEFFLSKCPESIKNRNDIFYPVPERSCVPDSPVWYSTQSIDIHTMDKMLTRVLLVREIQEAHLHAQPIYL